MDVSYSIIIYNSKSILTYFIILFKGKKIISGVYRKRNSFQIKPHWSH